jgi:hypothetical protein
MKLVSMYFMIKVTKTFSSNFLFKIKFSFGISARQTIGVINESEIIAQLE